MIVMMAPVVSMVPAMTIVVAVMSPAIMIHSVILAIPSIIHPGIIAATVSTIATVPIGK
jgi:hypothetical protein